MITEKKGVNRDYPWRVKVLNKDNAGTGLVKGYNCLFTIPNYWPYGIFNHQDRCELPGKLFRAKAGGERDIQHVYVTPNFWNEPIDYSTAQLPLYVAWRGKGPERYVHGGKFQFVCPADGPWEIWCNKKEDGQVIWHVNVKQKGIWHDYHFTVVPLDGDWFEVRLIMNPDALGVTINGESKGNFDHDAYTPQFQMQFGTGQDKVGGEEVISEYRYIFVNAYPYPDDSEDIPDGPEDVRPEDDAICTMLCEATLQKPRMSEGDLIQLKDGSLYAIWSDYYAGTGWDGSPARLMAKISRDGGRTWSEPEVVVTDEHDTNVMSVSLLYNKNGELLLAYYDQLPGMSTKGMVLRRSDDDAKTWSEPVRITPETGNRHAANNACLRTFSNGRIALSCREYIDDIRWPYCLYSDDNGYTWQAGKHVPDPDLTESQKRGQNVNEPSIAELSAGRLLMTMRSIAGGQFFSYSDDWGETWTKPELSPLIGTCSPAAIKCIPSEFSANSATDVLAIFTYGFNGRTPLTSAISSDGGKTWKNLKLVEQSEYHGYCYTSITFVEERIFLTYMHYPNFTSLMRFDVEPGYIDLRLTSLPLAWFYRSQI
ncbi:exo-alpha-sialidase [bacterium]|nr:exo-alpha-sialidase [bacterium]